MGKKHSRCNYNTKIFCLKKRCHEITCFCKAALVLLVCCLNTLISFSMSGNAMNLLRKRENCLIIYLRASQSHDEKKTVRVNRYYSIKLKIP